ncbi:MAG: SusC/RagA family TonB-linked outer membrane protein [Gemmatimonadaceae bacterium]|jgi:TonB-linked SusC/RagA family outer membrane protein|nr:SusC/RagA family TonB-linked outer membrane protein [Gemmatimonadaceae bacterium]
MLRPLIRAAALAALTLAPSALLAQEGGTVRGTVTEQGGTAPLASAQVTIVGTRLGALTDASGRFLIRGATAGSALVRVVRLGYQPATQTVQIPATGEVTVSFALERAVKTLDAVVTTATGEQSRKSYGNVVATVKADSLIEKAAATNVNELLQGRVAGVQVIQGSGQTGTSSSIRIRGTSSLSLTNEPLIIVDGVRIDNSPAPGNFSTQRINNFNGLNPEEIESMDILKGPSASALYGTAAANGVIVIKTKRGQVGATKWATSVEAGQVSQPAQFFDNYRAWGRNVVGGVPGTAAVLCRISDQALGRCVRDSLTTFNPLMNPETRPFATQPRFQVGVNASGGNDNLKYFFSAERMQETGPYRMPDAEIDRLTTLRGTRPTPEQIEPNRLTQTSLRGNFTFPLGKKADMSVSTGYIDRGLYSPFDGGFFAGLSFQSYFAPGFRTAFKGNSAQFSGDILSVTQFRRDQRFTGSTQINWKPVSWLQTRAVTGLDQIGGYSYRFARANEGTNTGWGPPGQTGGRDANRNTFSRYSVDLGATASFTLTPAWSTKTNVGAQWFKDTQYETVVQGYTLPPGAQTPNSASIRTSSEFTSENATLGAFAQQDLIWNDRLFLTASVRTDQNSAFGGNVGNTVYPRASVSYVLSEEPWFPQWSALTNFRVRAAWGQAGVPPGTIAALQFLNANTVPLGGTEVGALRLGAIGNSRLLPEVTTETETGFDLGLFNSRVNIEATYFRKLSRDALFQNPLPPSFGAGANQWQNIAAVLNAGAELALDVQLLNTSVLTWSTRLNGSRIENKLVDAGNAQLAITQGSRNVVGYPAFGLWARPIKSFADANGDGILTENEIVVGDTAEFKGPSLPVNEMGWSNTFGFFKNSVQVSTLFDYRGGFYNQWGFENQRCISGNCEAVNVPGSSLRSQAAAVTTTSARLGNSVWGFFEPNDFIRFRELSVSYTLPTRFANRLRARSTNIALVGRNIGMIWTRFPGIDPESNSAVQNTGGGNNDFFAAPLLRYWTVRVNMGF